MRLVLFTDTFPPDVNGVSMTLSRWTEWLRERGVALKVFAPDPPKGDESRDFVERFLSAPFFLYPPIRLGIPNPLRAQRSFREFRPDLCHIATPGTMGLFGRYLCRRFRVPMVASYHTHLDRYLAYYRLEALQGAYESLNVWFHAPMERVYVPSRETWERLEAMGIRRLELFPRGVDARLFHPPQDPEAARRLLRARYGIDAPLLLLYVGRIAVEKDLDVLVDAFAYVSPAVRRDLALLVVGDGPYRGEFERKVAQAGVPVRFAGFLRGADLREAYQGADLFVFPSSTETYGNVVQEAMAVGLPVLGVSAGGVAERVVHGETGWLVTPRDPESFARGIELLARDEGLRRRLGRAGHTAVRPHTWDAVFSRLFASMQEVALRASGDPDHRPPWSDPGRQTSSARGRTPQEVG